MNPDHGTASEPSSRSTVVCITAVCLTFAAAMLWLALQALVFWVTRD